MTELSLAIASDIHAGIARGQDPQDSYVAIEPPAARRDQHPLADIIALVKENGIRADYLLCPGDMTNRDDDRGKMYAWRRLNELKKALEAKRLIATPGNHDISTRIAGVDPTSTLQNLEPTYPSEDATVAKKFWSDGIALIEDRNIRFVILNSCHGHGPYPDNATSAELEEYFEGLNRGSFSPQQQDILADMLRGMDECPINVLLCHHHPKEHERRELFKDGYGSMRGGDELLRLLETSPRTGRWLIVHGHKHIPQLVTASGDINSPIVLGSGSMGGALWHPIVTVTRNQFHLVHFPLDKHPDLASLRGRVESYMWGVGAGWTIASRHASGLPPRCGFGVPIDHRILASKVDSYLRSRALEFDDWSKVIGEIPALEFQTPSELLRFEDQLANLGLMLQRDRNEQIVEVARVKV